MGKSGDRNGRGWPINNLNDVVPIHDGYELTGKQPGLVFLGSSFSG